MRIRTYLFAILLGSLVLSSQAQQQQHLFFQVTLGPQITQSVSGRLMVFLSKGTKSKEIDINPFFPTATYVAAKEITNLSPGASVEIDTDDAAFPAQFSSLPEGDYQVQAVLDINHSYGYDGRAEGDLVSGVLDLLQWKPTKGEEPKLILNEILPGPPEPKTSLSQEQKQAAESAIEQAEFKSTVLTSFSGRDTYLRGWVVLPPKYREHPQEHFPTVYWTHGFGGGLRYAKQQGMAIYDRMSQGKMPPMIWVMLDESLPTGTHEFANSVNNGPWGTALTTEFIPWLEKKYRMEAKPSGRFLQGHSSGGWATLQLQVNYPRTFGGTWSTSPDPSDFHDFTGVDLYAQKANLYYRPDGSPYPLIRNHEKVVATFEQFAKLESILGNYGGQLASFEWVFSPRGADGRPLKMFNRETGNVDAAVVRYWGEHYDLARIAVKNWSADGANLKGRIHLIVGTDDTFYLDGAAHRFEAVLKQLGADPHFTYKDRRTHFDLYKEGDDRMALLDQIAKEMYAVARPQSASAH